MNEIQLSSDINVITAEINSYKQIAGQSIWEIGRRLNYVKENDLAHGEFSKWLETVSIEHSEANRFMKVAKELPNYDNWHNLSNRAIYLIATLPEEEKQQQIERVENGEVIKIREVEELKKQLKQKDKQIENLSDVITELDNREPEIQKVEVEKIPDDYYRMKESTKVIDEITQENNRLKAEQESLKKKLEESSIALETKNRMENDEIEQAQLKRLQRDSDISVHKLIINLNDFVKEQAITVYDSQAIGGASVETKEKLTESIYRVENLLKQIKQEIGGETAWVIN